MYLDFEQITATDTVKTVAALSIPATATMAELQADTQPVRYTMDGATDPTASSGMVLATSHMPKQFTTDELQSLRFIRGAGSDGKLNVHYCR